MAAPTPASRPGRALTTIALLVIVMYAGAFLLQGMKPKPKLGLDLQGGTSVTLTARLAAGEKGDISGSAMNQAKRIIEDRVNGTGVAEAEVTVQGDRNIVVNIPGDELKTDLLSTALLRFRPVLQVGQATPAPGASPSATPSGTASPNGTASPSASPATSPSPSATGNGRAVSGALLSQQSSTPSPSPTPTATGTPSPGTGQGQGSTEITPAIQKQFDELDCAKAIAARKGQIEPANEILVTCDSDGFKYILGPTAVEGTHINGAQASLPSSGVGSWQVNLSFDGTGTKQFAETTKALVSKTDPQNRFAIVLDGEVVSAPVVQSEIPTGQAEITGSFTQAEAKDLANVLKYGALPLAFDQSELNEISPTLGSDYLRVGLIAGVIGLVLVFIYSLIYYRGLGLVSIASLGMAALLTYVSVVLLGEWIGFTLTLAGIAGLIVAVGITADSFVVFFERIRDEVRDGRSLRASVEHGWVRARRTILVADFVSFLAAAVLYILSIGSVRGFAFALGLVTVVDVIVVFFFTKPLVTLLARTKFYGGGHPWSGLDPVRLGRTQAAPGQPQTIVGRRRAAAEEA